MIHLSHCTKQNTKTRVEGKKAEDENEKKG